MPLCARFLRWFRVAYRAITVSAVVMAVLAAPSSPAQAQGPTAAAPAPKAASASAFAPGDRPSFRGLNAYYGEMHQHTGYSPDGCGLPEDAIRRAYSNGNDFLALTEHHNSFFFPQIGDPALGCREEEIDLDKWGTLGELAEQFTSDGAYVVLRGFEHTRDQGHLNIFNSDAYTTPVQLDDLLSWLAGQPPEVHAQLNHPLPHDWAGIGDFDDFLAFPPVATKVTRMELAAGPPYELFYGRALSAGWRVSAVGWGDGHHANVAGTKRYGIFADAITRANLDQALVSGRTFGNTDGKLAVALLGNGQWMGAPLEAGRVQFEIYAADRNGDTIERIELVGPQGVIAAVEPGANPAEWSPVVEAAAPGDFFYAQVIDSTGARAWSGSMAVPVYRRLETNPAALRFGIDPPEGGPEVRRVILSANDGADTSWRVSSDAAWLRFEPASGETLPATISVSVSYEGLSGPRSAAAMRFVSETGSHQPTMVGVKASSGALADANLSLSPRVATLATTLAQPTLSGQLSLATTDTAAAWYAASTVPWLQLPVDAGVLGQGSGPLDYQIDLSDYPMGRYVGHIVAMAGATVRVSEVRVDLLPRNPIGVALRRGGAVATLVADTYVDAYAPSQAYGASTSLHLLSDGMRIGLLRFDLSQIPASAQVYSATLDLYAVARSADGYLLLYAHPLAEAWREGEATWTQRAAGLGWSAGALPAPGRAGRVGSAAELPIYNLGRWHSLEATSLVRGWVADPESNHGLSIGSQGGSVATLYSFQSSEATGGDQAWRPRLSITYGDPEPTPEPTLTPGATGEMLFLPLLLLR